LTRMRQSRRRPSSWSIKEGGNRMLDLGRSSRITRMAFLKRGVGLVAALGGTALLAACASTPAAPTAAPAAPAAPPQPTPAPPTAPTTAPAPAAATPTSAPQVTPAAATATPQAAVSSQTKAQNQVLRIGASIPILSGIFPAGFSSQDRTMLSNV